MQDAAQEQNGSPWHAQAGDAVLAELKATPKGLDHAEAESRLATFGPNRLPVARQRGMLSRFLAQFHNVLIYVLLGSAAITAFLGHGVDTGVILAVVLANAVIGFLQEGKAEKAMTSIRQMLAPRANVLRDDERRSGDPGQWPVQMPVDDRLFPFDHRDSPPARLGGGVRQREADPEPSDEHCRIRPPGGQCGECGIDQQPFGAPVRGVHQEAPVGDDLEVGPPLPQDDLPVRALAAVECDGAVSGAAVGGRHVLGLR